jgi:FkbM family methyltransferase
MNNSDLLNSLEKAIALSKIHPVRKIIQPKIVLSKILEKISLFSKMSYRIKATTFWGEKMNVLIPEVVSLNLYRYGYFEEGLTRMVLEYLKPGMVFFDIGSHFGYYTLLASYIVGDNGQVHAFEPTKSTFDILRLNTQRKTNVILNNLAVSSKRGKVLINDYGVRYSAWNSVYNARLPKYIISNLKAKQCEVEAASIDEYVQEYNVKPDFIKIDAESHEYAILLGMQQTIEKFHPIITIEVGDFDIEGVPTSRTLVEFLIGKGYQPYEYREGKVFRHIPKDKYYYENILFLPKG